MDTGSPSVRVSFGISLDWATSQRCISGSEAIRSMRRWHGHPVWPNLLALKGRLELRTNWLVYAEEFEQALLLSGYKPAPKTTLENAEVLKNPITLFEKKYAENQHVLTQLQVQL